MTHKTVTRVKRLNERSYADEAVEMLNRYEEEDGENTWVDVVYKLAGYDEEMAGRIDPAGHSDQVPFEDGSVAYYSHERGEWRVADCTAADLAAELEYLST